ncbi:hypothetical protein AB6D20_027660 (plasmid) [Vibrio splendidus]
MKLDEAIEPIELLEEKEKDSQHRIEMAEARAVLKWQRRAAITQLINEANGSQ